MTRILVISILVISLAASWSQRKFGFGVADLSFNVGAVLKGELWRLITYPLVDSQPWNLVFSLVVLWLFGGSFESRWGPRDFLRFFAVSCIGAAVIAIPLSFLFNLVLPFNDMGMAEGPWTALNAMLVALALTSPDSNVLFGFVLPIRTRTVVLIILAFQVIVGIQTGTAALSVTLGGMAMGYLLVTGRWRPQRLLEALRRHRPKRRRGGLYVVPPKDRTLH